MLPLMVRQAHHERLVPVAVDCIRGPTGSATSALESVEPYATMPGVVRLSGIVEGERLTCRNTRWALT